MNTYEFINKEWIVSPRARRVHRAAAAISLTLYFSVFAAVLNVKTPFLRQIVLLGVVGTALTLIAMEFFLFRFDVSPAWKQILWFFAMLIPPLGPALYCLVVYSRSPVFGATADTQNGVVDNSKPLA